MNTLVFEKPYSPSALWIRAAGEIFEQVEKIEVPLIVGGHLLNNKIFDHPNLKKLAP
jgi:hypothetical protein